MPAKKPLSSKEVTTQLFAFESKQRLSALKQVVRLPKKDAVSLLKKAVTHWDQHLRQAASLLLVKLTGPDASKMIIDLGKQKLIPQKLMLTLLGKCDSEESANHLYSYIVYHQGTGEQQQLASQSLNTLSNAQAVLHRWRLGKRLIASTKKRLDAIPDAFIRRYIATLSDVEKAVFLNDSTTRKYFEHRGLLKKEYVYLDSAEYAIKQLTKRYHSGCVTPELLDRLTDDQLSTCLKQISPDDRKYWQKTYTTTATYLRKRGLTLAEEAQKAVSQKVPILKTLAEQLDLPCYVLGELYSQWGSIDEFYQEFEIAKSNGKKRTILAPDDTLKWVQRAIYEQLLSNADMPDNCHGFRRGRSIVTNAAPHVAKPFIINLDLRDFFPSISAARVYGIFRCLGSDKDSARFLTRLTTYKGHLPQGAPTSPALANLICRKLDRRLEGLAKKINACYTRYADDLTFSGERTIISALPTIRKIITEEKLQIAMEKIRLTGRGNRQEVTGLVVNDKVSVPRRLRRRLRAALHHMTNGKKPFWNGHEAGLSTLLGQIAFQRSVSKDVGDGFAKELDCILKKRKHKKTDSDLHHQASRNTSNNTTIEQARQVVDPLAAVSTNQHSAKNSVCDSVSLPTDMPEILKTGAELVLGGKRDAAVQLFNYAIAEGEDPVAVRRAIIATMRVACDRFRQNAIYLPELMIITRAVRDIHEQIRSLPQERGNFKKHHLAVIGTANGDMNGIGKDMVAMMWDMADFSVTDLGVSVPPEQFVSTAQRLNAHLVGISVLLTTTMSAMEDTVKCLRDAGVSAKIMVGGCPVTERFAAEIGADGYAPDCVSAMDLALKLMGMPEL